MKYFTKGAEDVFDVLGVKPGVVSDLREKVVENVPEPIKRIKEEIGQSYRATPYTVLFGRYRDTTGRALKSLKERIQELFE